MGVLLLPLILCLLGASPKQFGRMTRQRLVDAANHPLHNTMRGQTNYSAVMLALDPNSHRNHMVASSIINVIGTTEQLPIQVFTFHKSVQEGLEKHNILSQFVYSGRLSVILLKRPSQDKNWGRDHFDVQNRNEVLSSEYFWHQCEGEKLLLFDHTTRLCSGTDHNLHEFMEWDWIGAPWIWADPKSEFVLGGNGALSIRTRAKMIQCLQKFSNFRKAPQRGVELNEDMYFVKHLPLIGARVAPRDVGIKFAVEEIPYERPFGVSYGMRTVPGAKRKAILEFCPEARMLVGYLPGASWVMDWTAENQDKKKKRDRKAYSLCNHQCCGGDTERRDATCFRQRRAQSVEVAPL